MNEPLYPAHRKWTGEAGRERHRGKEAAQEEAGRKETAEETPTMELQARGITSSRCLYFHLEGPSSPKGFTQVHPAHPDLAISLSDPSLWLQEEVHGLVTKGLGV